MDAQTLRTFTSLRNAAIGRIVTKLPEFSDAFLCQLAEVLERPEPSMSPLRLAAASAQRSQTPLRGQSDPPRVAQGS